MFLRFDRFAFTSELADLLTQGELVFPPAANHFERIHFDRTEKKNLESSNSASGCEACLSAIEESGSFTESVSSSSK